jgi:PhnB protein
MLIQPYLYFDGRCEEALGFYGAKLGAKVDVLMRFNEAPTPHPPGMVPPGAESKIMHSSFRIGDNVIMASDGQCMGKPTFQGVSLSITVTALTEGERLFAALGEGGQVQMPLGKTFFSPGFGMLADRFGVNWMIIVFKPE